MVAYNNIANEMYLVNCYIIKAVRKHLYSGDRYGFADVALFRMLRAALWSWSQRVLQLVQVWWICFWDSNFSLCPHLWQVVVLSFDSTFSTYFPSLAKVESMMFRRVDTLAMVRFRFCGRVPAVPFSGVCFSETCLKSNFSRATVE